MFRGQSVVDSDNDTSDYIRQRSTNMIVGFEVTNDPTTSGKVNKRRSDHARVWVIDPDWNTICVLVAYSGYRFSGISSIHCAIHGPRCLWRTFVHWWGANLGSLSQNGCQDWI